MILIRKGAKILMFNLQPCEERDKASVIDNLVAYNLRQVPPVQEELFYDLSNKIVDEDGNIIGGIIAGMYCWNCVYIDALWVADDYRGRDLGSKLIQAVEACGRRKGAYLFHLDTFDFQAKGFYEKLGYAVFGVLEDCPRGHNRYYLKKHL